ncbi:peptidoglycan-binding domain-containing protein [Streptomyces sp. NPDC002092]
MVEAQCLLRRRGWFDSGRLDGVYGEKTGRAARALQERYGLAPDGIVGPGTWKKLRT